jgi:hypothetical protein
MPQREDGRIPDDACARHRARMPAAGLRITCTRGGGRLLAEMVTNADGRTDAPILPKEGRSRRGLRADLSRRRLPARDGSGGGGAAFSGRGADPLRHQRRDRRITMCRCCCRPSAIRPIAAARRGPGPRPGRFARYGFTGRRRRSGWYRLPQTQREPVMFDLAGIGSGPNSRCAGCMSSPPSPGSARPSTSSRSTWGCGRRRTCRRRDGEEWQVHGGGFYHIQKYMVAPERSCPST